MNRMSRRWVGIGIAVLVVGALALYAASAGNQKVSTTSTTGSATLGTLSLPADPAAPPVAAAPVMTAGTVAGLVVKIGIVAVILGACLWLLRRYAGNTSRGGGRTGAVSIVDTLTLAQGRSVYVLDVGDRALIVGATAQQLSLLAEMTDPDALARLRTVPERPAPPFAGLSQRFTAAIQGFGAAQNARTAMAGVPGTMEEVLVADTPTTPRIRPARATSFSDTLAAADGRGATPRNDLDGQSAPGERLAELAAKLRAMRGTA